MSQSLRIGTFNIRFDSSPQYPLNPASVPQREGPAQAQAVLNPQLDHRSHPEPGKAEQPWHVRRAALADQVLFHSLDIIGFQEVLHHQHEDLRILLGGQYESVGVGRKDGKQHGEAECIFFKRDKLQLQDVHYFWLSKTPTEPGSKGWDAANTRVTTQATLVDRHTQRIVHVTNTHLDHKGPLSRYHAAKMILGRVQHMGDMGALVIALGDFNCERHSEGYSTLTGGVYQPSTYQPSYIDPSAEEPAPKHTFVDVTYEMLTRDDSSSSALPPLLSKPFGEHATCNGFKVTEKSQTIDYILALNNDAVALRGSPLPAPGKWHITRHGVSPNSFDNGFRVSDHRLVMAEFFLHE